MFVLVDCNNFFASCERLFRPDLWHKPVLVLSNNDGCVIARSQEVKDMGIEMGAPFFKCRSIVERNKVHVSLLYLLFFNYSGKTVEIWNLERKAKRI